MAKLVQYLHPLSDGQVLVLFIVRERVPLLFEILTTPFNVELEEKWPVVFTTARGEREGEGEGEREREMEVRKRERERERTMILNTSTS